MMLTAEWISRTSRADQRAMLNPKFIFFLRIFELTCTCGVEFSLHAPHTSMLMTRIACIVIFIEVN